MDSHTPIHVDALEAARRIADRNGEFTLRDVVAALPHRNPATVRTHVASRCCVNAPANHQSRWRYFRALGGGRYRLESAMARPIGRRRLVRRQHGSQDRIAESLRSEIDAHLIASNLRLMPTERLERMRRILHLIESTRAANAGRLSHAVRTAR